MKRIEWADITKFFAIALMVSGHIGLPNTLSNVVHMFHMPVFFFIAGSFYSSQKYRKFTTFLWSRFKSLLIPYFVWGIISYLIYRLISYNTGDNEIVSTGRFIQALFSQDANEVLFKGYGVIQWFFTALFISEILLWVIVRISEHVKKSYLPGYYVLSFGLLFAANLIVCNLVEPNWLGFKSAILGTLFCYIGFVSKDIVKKYLDAGNKLKIIVSLAAVVVFVGVFFLNGKVNMRTAAYNNSLLFILGALSGSLLLITVSRFIECHLSNGLWKSYILYIGRNTALILCVNRLVQCTIIELLNQLLSSFVNIDNGIGLHISRCLDLVAEMILFVPLIYIVNRWLPFTLGKKITKQES